MRLHPLLAALDRYPDFERLVESLRTPSGAGPRVLSAITPARAFALAALHAALRRPMLLITGRPSEARVYANELRAWARDPEAVLLFPETDALPYDRLPNDPDKLAERLSTLERLSGLQHAQTAIAAPGRRVGSRSHGPGTRTAGVPRQPPRRAARSGPAARRARHPVARLGLRAVGAGRSSRASSADAAASLTCFRPAASRCVSSCGAMTSTRSVLFDPGHAALDEAAGLRLDRARARGSAKAARRRAQHRQSAAAVHRRVRAGPAPAARRRARVCLARVLSGLSGLGDAVDYLPEDGVLVLEEPDGLTRFAVEFEEQVEQLHADLLERGEVPPGLARPYRPWREATRRVRADCVELRFDPDVEGLPFAHAPKYGSRLEPFLASLVEGKFSTIVVSQQASRLSRAAATSKASPRAPTTAVSDPASQSRARARAAARGLDLRRARAGAAH